MKLYVKRFIAFVVFTLCPVIIFWCVDYSINQTKDEVEKGSVVSWLQALCDKDYDLCDSFVPNDGFKIRGYNRTTQYVLNPFSSQIYYKFLDFAIDSVQNINILSIEDNIGTGYIEYKIEVEYYPYEVINELIVDSEKLTDLLDKYIQEEISNEDLESELQDYYLDLFISCFKLNDKSTVSKVLVLSEKKNKDGVVFVYNTKAFIKDFISDEMYKNLEVYQDSIKAKVDTILRQY